jgi:pimeloyl-ACP methyl ester carboxylesterase
VIRVTGLPGQVIACVESGWFRYVTSCGLRIFMYQPAGAVLPQNAHSGHFGSRMRAPGRVSACAKIARCPAEFINSISGEPVDVIGNSFGGWIACWLAVLAPERVNRIVLESPAGFSPDGSGQLEGDPATYLARAFAHPEKRRPETKSPEMIAANRAAAFCYSGGVVRDDELVALLFATSTSRYSGCPISSCGASAA